MSTPSRVAWNLLWLVPGEVGGTEQFALRHLAALRAAADAPEIVVLANRSSGVLPDLEGLEVRIAPTTGRSRARRVLAAGPWMARTLRRSRVDVSHHLGGTIPTAVPQPTVLTVQDLLPLDRPAAFPLAKRAYLRRALPSSIGRATVVMTPSEFVRGQILERFDRPSETVVVAPAPVTASPAPPPATVESVRQRLALDRDYVVYPAIAYPHKNHATLIDAFGVLRDRGTELDLVLTGGPGPDDAVIEDRIGLLGLGQRVHRTGRLSDADLDVVLHEATALAFPSTWEGFGLPVAEAMARGCPVVAADASALPEAVQEAGLLVDPGDAGAWADALESIVTDPDRAAELGAAGRLRVSSLAPAVAATRLIAAYRLAWELGR